MITPDASAGGWAYVNSFTWSTDQICTVNTAGVGTGAKNVSEVASHEVGHTLGLSHDGTTTGTTYYSGWGSGEVGWAPIMGVGYYKNLTQFSQGEYVDANQTQNDLSKITNSTNGFGYRDDDYGDDAAGAELLSGVQVAGIIERNTDVDVFAFAALDGALTIDVDHVPYGPNLDILAELYDSSWTLLQSSDPLDLLEASISTTVTEGVYYLLIDGTGRGPEDWTTGNYGDYGSIGQYTINVTQGTFDADARDDDVDVLKNRAQVVAVLGNDYDLGGDVLSITGITQGTSGAVVNNGDGTLTYTPNTDYVGADAFTYTIDDGNGNTDTATVNVNVYATPLPGAHWLLDETTGTTAADDSGNGNDGAIVGGVTLGAPSRIGTAMSFDGSGRIDVGTPLALDGQSLTISAWIRTNVDGVTQVVYEYGGSSDGYQLAVDDFGLPTFVYRWGSGPLSQATAAGGEHVNDGQWHLLTATVDASAGEIRLFVDGARADTAAVTIATSDPSDEAHIGASAGGSSVKLPDAFQGEIDDVRLYDSVISNGAIADLHAAAPNVAHTAVDDGYTIDEDTPTVLDVSANDDNPDGDFLAFESFTQGADGAVTDNGDGTLTYTPDADWHGGDSFTYTVTDGEFSSAATVTVTVDPVNDDPAAGDDVMGTTVDTPVIVSVLTNDSDVDTGDTLAIDSFTQGANGAVSDNGDGTLTYTPDASFTGDDSFTYTAGDGNGGTDTATVSMTVYAVLPVAHWKLDEITGTTVVDSTGNGHTGTLVGGAVPGAPSRDGAAVDLDGSDDNIQIAGYKGILGEASRTVTAWIKTTDNNGTIVSWGENTTGSKWVFRIQNSNGTDGAIRVEVNGGAVVGTTDLRDGRWHHVAAVLDSDGTPNANEVLLYVDGVYDGVSYSSSEAIDTLSSLDVTLGVKHSSSQFLDGSIDDVRIYDRALTVGELAALAAAVPNLPPTANDDTAQTSEDTAVVIALLLNDGSPDGDALSVDSFTQGANGTVTDNGDGTLTYTPDADFNGSDSFTYTAGDGIDASGATVNVTIGAVNDAPTAVDDEFDMDADSVLAGNVLDNDTDVESDPLAVLSVDTMGLAGILTIETMQTLGEFGTVTALDEVAQTITLSRDYVNPVVIAQPLSFEGSDAAVARITSVTNNTGSPDSFTVYVQEATGLDGSHSEETLHYMVLEAGLWELADGRLIEVGTLTTSNCRISSGGDAFVPVSFSSAFGAAPAILTQTQTANDADFVKTRQQNSAASGFGVVLEEAEADDAVHATETIGYVAIEAGAGWAGGLQVESSLTTLPNDADNGNFAPVSFATDLGATPGFLGAITTYEGANPVELRNQNLTGTSVELTIEEDKSNDSETGHSSEDVAYVAFSAGGSIVGRAQGETADGAFTYDPNGAFDHLAVGETAVETFTYTVDDNRGGGDTATVTITVHGPDGTPPVVVGVALNGDAGKSVSSIEPSGIGVQTVEITFSEAATFTSGDVTLQKITFPGGTETLGDVLTPTSIVGSGTDTMTITFDSAAVVDTWVKVTLDGSATIEDLAGNALDGEAASGGSGRGYIYDGSTDLPTGDGAAGGDAVFYVGSLRGDLYGGDLFDPDPNGELTDLDVAGFIAAYQGGNLDADFYGGDLFDPIPDGALDDLDVAGFIAAYQAGASLDALPASLSGAAEAEAAAAAAPEAGSSSTPSSAGAVTTDYVIQVVFDGFRPDAITTLGATELPNVYRMINEGLWAGNARADYSYTETLPNHTDMLTSRPVAGGSGHGVTFNSDNGSTVHASAGAYVTSVFDIVHDNGLRTGLYASKSKFEFYDRSWNATNGRADPIGADDGRDKIDVYEYNSTTSQLKSTFIADMGAVPYNYVMISFRDPDSTGHSSGWMSSAYLDAVRTVDGYLGEIFSMIEGSPTLNGKTSIILTADHGGTGTGHGTASDSLNYTIPLLAWGPDVTAGGDLYTMNPDTRQYPDSGRPGNSATPQPIRNGDSGNLATQLLGLGAIDDSLFNSAHDLVVMTTPPDAVDDPYGLLADATLTVNATAGVLGNDGDLSPVLSVDTTGLAGNLAFQTLQPLGEVGTIAAIDEVAQTITLSRDYVNPVVIAQPLSFNGADAAVARITTVTNNTGSPDSFTVYLQEATGLDGAHSNEKLHYLVLEAGLWELADGRLLEVGTLTTSNCRSSGSGDPFVPVSFSSAFSVAPVILSQTQTANDTDFVKTRQTNAGAGGFDVILEEAGGDDATHAAETIGYIAIESGAAAVGGGLLETGQAALPSTADEGTFEPVGFSVSLGATPGFLGAFATYNGSDPAELRHRNLSGVGVELTMEEDIFGDPETAHAAEDVAYLVFSDDGLIQGTTQGAADADGAFLYDPNGAFDYLAPGATATDTFTYTAGDLSGGTDTATVTITITGTDSTPPAVVGVTLNGDAGRSVSDTEPSGIGVQTIEITFSEAVTFTSGDVTLQKVTFPGGTEAVGDTLTPTSIVGSGTTTMTVTFDSASVVDTWVKVTLDGSATIEDLAGNALDGEAASGGSGRGYIYDSAADLPTGDAAAGGDAVFYVGSLRGDLYGGDLFEPDPNGELTDLDVAGFIAAYQSDNLDADFYGGDLFEPIPEGVLTDLDVAGFIAVYQAGASLDPLPTSLSGVAEAEAAAALSLLSVNEPTAEPQPLEESTTSEAEPERTPRGGAKGRQKAFPPQENTGSAPLIKSGSDARRSSLNVDDLLVDDLAPLPE